MGAEGDADAAEKRRAKLAALRRNRDPLDSPEHKLALEILQKALRSKGATRFHEEPPTAVSHQEAAQWITSPPKEIDQSVANSVDTANIKQKLVEKLQEIANPVTPENIVTEMKDMVDYSAQKIAEQLVAEMYEVKSREAVIAGMQSELSEDLIAMDGKTETSYFAAQRLKRAGQFKADGSAPKVEAEIAEKIACLIKKRPMPRTIAPAVKEKTQDAAKFLSTKVTTPDEYIENLVILLNEMEKNPDQPIVKTAETKTCGEAGNYLRGLVTFDDRINIPNEKVYGEIKKNMQSLVAPKIQQGISKPVMDEVITGQAKLYTSYVMLDEEKRKALECLVTELDNKGKTLLLRYGHVRKSHKDGADLLRGKKPNELLLDETADDVVVRKLDVKITAMMKDVTPTQYKSVMPAVIQDVNNFLAIQLFEPRVIKICKCMKSVQIQCELGSEAYLHYVRSQPCTCSRYINVQDIEELGPSPYRLICPGTTKKMDSNTELSILTCKKKSSKKKVCESKNPSKYCMETRYVHISPRSNKNYEDDHPSRISGHSSIENSSSSEKCSISFGETKTTSTSTVQELLRGMHQQKTIFYVIQEANKYHTESGAAKSLPTSPRTKGSRSPVSKSQTPVFISPVLKSPSTVFISTVSKNISPVYTSPTPRSTPSPFSNAFTSYERTNEPKPITISEQMGDWHAMIVSLMWNMHAWRKWIQETIDKGSVVNKRDQDLSTSELEALENEWMAFQRRVSTEGLQWRQYNIFSRKLTLRLISRYNNKEVVSQLEESEKNIFKTYKKYANEMLDLIDMLNRWTQWILLIIRENPIQNNPSSTRSKPATSWNYYKKKIDEFSYDWATYNLHLKSCWDIKYRIFTEFDCITGPGPVWVVSACGAVPSGAVAGGVYDGEIIWIARTTHRNRILPAALHPSKHCCIVYADGVVCHYTKYQVMCNAEVQWVHWRGGRECTNAICAANGVFIGRVRHHESHLIGPVYAPHYQCHIIVYGQPFAFNRYEILVSTSQSS